jgi:hypothetical protein
MKKFKIKCSGKKTMPNNGSGFCTLTHTQVKPICTKIVSRSNFNVFQIEGFGEKKIVSEFENNYGERPTLTLTLTDQL